MGFLKSFTVQHEATVSFAKIQHSEKKCLRKENPDHAGNRNGVALVFDTRGVCRCGSADCAKSAGPSYHPRRVRPDSQTVSPGLSKQTRGNIPDPPRPRPGGRTSSSILDPSLLPEERLVARQFKPIFSALRSFMLGAPVRTGNLSAHAFRALIQPYGSAKKS
jgi:hypothetical protein